MPGRFVQAFLFCIDEHIGENKKHARGGTSSRKNMVQWGCRLK